MKKSAILTIGTYLLALSGGNANFLRELEDKAISAGLVQNSEDFQSLYHNISGCAVNVTQIERVNEDGQMRYRMEVTAGDNDHNLYFSERNDVYIPTPINGKALNFTLSPEVGLEEYSIDDYGDIRHDVLSFGVKEKEDGVFGCTFNITVDEFFLNPNAKRPPSEAPTGTYSKTPTANPTTTDSKAPSANPTIPNITPHSTNKKINEATNDALKVGLALALMGAGATAYFKFRGREGLTQDIQRSQEITGKAMAGILALMGQAQEKTQKTIESTGVQLSQITSKFPTGRS